MVAAAIGDWDHPQAGPGALVVATDDDAATVGDGAVDLGEGHRTSGLHIVTMERWECDASLGVMCAARVPGGRFGRLRVQVWVDCTLSPLGSRVMRGTVAGMMLVAGASVVRKWMGALESRMAQFLMVVASVEIVLRRMEAASA